MKSKQRIRLGLMPVLMALPVAAGLGFFAVRYGQTVRNLIHVAIKLVVTK